MATRLKLFDRSRLRLAPLSERQHDLDASVILPLEHVSPLEDPGLDRTGQALVEARRAGASAIAMLGGHVVRSGVQRQLIDLMERGLVGCLAMNGSVVIHDYELALIGATTESVARYVRDGRFGLWSETGRINDIVNAGAAEGLGLGEAVGRAILEEGLPGAETSLLAQAWRLGLPATVHVGIGHDIIHEHPNFDAAATGAASYRDFLAFTRLVENLEGGVLSVFGSAVMAPEVFLKALAMARNAAAGEGRGIRRFTTLVCDLRPLPPNIAAEPAKTNPDYYFRPWKTLLVRTVEDGGQSFYVSGPHRETVPALRRAALKAAGEAGPAQQGARP